MNEQDAINAYMERRGVFVVERKVVGAHHGKSVTVKVKNKREEFEC